MSSISSRISQNAPETSRSQVTSPTEKLSRRKQGASQEGRRTNSNPTFVEDQDDILEYEEEADEYDARRSSSSSQSNRGRKRSASIPMSPPSVGSDDDYYQDDAREIRAENVLGNWHFAPLLIAIVPPLGAVLGGGADAWSDAILLVIASFYLYQLLKVPHDIYHTARTRRVLHGDAEDEHTESGNEAVSRELKRERQAAAAELKKAEIISLAALVLSPVAGAWLLHWLMETFTDGNRYLNTFNIRLFMLASGIKPWSHAISLLRKRLLHLQEVVHYPSSRIEVMNRRLGKLEVDITSLRKLVATKTDVSLLRDGIDAPLTQLSRTMRRYEKKEEHLRMSAEDKFSLMESRLEDLLREVAINAELIEEERRQRQRVVSLPFSIFQAVKYALGQKSQQESSHRELLYDTPRNLPSTSPLNLTAAPNAADTSKTSTTSSSSADSLPEYPSPTRYSRVQSNGTYQASPPPSSPGWTEEGLAYWMFLPINVPKSVFRSAFSFANSRVNVTSDPNYAQNLTNMASNGAHQERQSKITIPSSSSASSSSSLKTRFQTQDVNSPRIKSPSSHTAANYSRRA